MDGKDLIGVAEFDSMTPQQRADSVAAGVARSWDDVDPALREQIAAHGPNAEQRRRLGTR